MLIWSQQSRGNVMRATGFSLVEIAVVLVIIAILVTAVGIPLAAQLDQQRRTETQKQLEDIKEAIYGFALANGRLPCASRLADNGVESIVSANTGVCLAYSGFLPAVSLGLSNVDSNGFARDAWGLEQNRIRYAVIRIANTSTTLTGCPTTAVSEPFTKTGGISAATMSCLASYNNDGATPTALVLLTVCGATPTAVGAWPQAYCTASKLSITAPFVLISQGKNAPTGAAAGTDEAFNAVASGQVAVFVSRIPTSQGVTNEFDDIVTWGSLNTLFARMVQAGKLP